MYICHLHMRSLRTTSFKVQHHFNSVLYVLRIGFRYSDTLPLKHVTDASQYSVSGVDVRILLVYERKRC